MAICKFLPSKSPVKRALTYICNKEKTEARLITGINCMTETAVEEFAATKKLFGKTEGRQYYHIILAFSPEDDISLDLAHHIGLELAASFDDFQCVVATHKDKAHVHDHIIMNSVNCRTGRMFHQTKQELKQVKQFVNEQCRRYGLSITEPKAQRTGWPEWKKKLRYDALTCLSKSRNLSEFIGYMEEAGYGVNWQESHKYVTFTTPENQKCRSHKLMDERLFRENMEKYFALGGCESPIAEQFFDVQPPQQGEPFGGLAGMLDSFINGHPHLYRREYLKTDRKEAEKMQRKGKKVSQSDFINVEEDEEYEQYHGMTMSM